LHDWDGRVLPVRLLADDEVWPPSADAGIVARVVDELPDGDELELLVEAGPASRVRLRMVGRHMVADGLVAAGGALAAGLTRDEVVAGLATFGGVGRRLELKGDIAGVVVLDDYAHHPTAIQATYAAARQRYPGRRLWAVYEPLTYHRTAAMLEQFADVLAQADRAAVVDIWAIRDPDTSITSAAALAAATTARASFQALATGSPEATGDRLAELVEPGDLVLVMGGGRSTVAAERLVQRLRERHTA
jgi:UDP-N-acetylmuramate--alanine ligase